MIHPNSVDNLIPISNEEYVLNRKCICNTKKKYRSIQKQLESLQYF